MTVHQLTVLFGAVLKLLALAALAFVLRRYLPAWGVAVVVVPTVAYVLVSGLWRFYSR